MTPLKEKMRLLDQLLSQASGVVDDIGQSMGGIGSPHQTTNLLFDGKQAKTWRQSLLDWPRLNSSRVARISHAFDSNRFRDQFRPGEPRLVYVAACPGLRRVAMALHVPAFKVGSCAAWGLNRRITELRQDLYGAAWYDNDRYVVDDDFQPWFPSLIKCRLVPSPLSPVTVVGRAYQVILPESMSGDEFELKLQETLAPACLFACLETPDALRHCAAFEVDPAIGRRSTPYSRGDRLKLSPSTEIYCFRFQSDFDRLLCALESIVLEAVLGNAEA